LSFTQHANVTGRSFSTPGIGIETSPLSDARLIAFPNLPGTNPFEPGCEVAVVTTLPGC
jgi:hypothetical protein